MSRRWAPLMDRVFAGLEETPTGCWEWQKAKVRSADGYGSVHGGGRHHYVHRLTYEFFIGPVPEGLFLDHLCENKPCANPWHLDPVTASVNLRRARVNRLYKKGHPLPPQLPAGQRRRPCSTCNSTARRAAYRAKKNGVSP